MLKKMLLLLFMCLAVNSVFVFSQTPFYPPYNFYNCINDNPCNLICNPDLEYDGICDGGIQEHNSFYCPNFMGWWTFFPTPDYFFNINAPGSTGGAIYMGGLPAQSCLGEAVMNKVALTQNTNYVLSFFINGNSTSLSPPGSAPGGVVVELFEESMLPSLPFNYFTVTIPSNTSCFYSHQDLGTIMSNLNWEQKIIKFSASEDYDLLTFTSIGSPGAVTTADVFIDKFQLIEDNFTAGDDLTSSYCGASVTVGKVFCEIADVTDYQWYEMVNGVPQIISGATSTVLNVSPTKTTDYRLRRTIMNNMVDEDDVRVFVTCGAVFVDGTRFSEEWGIDVEVAENGDVYVLGAVQGGSPFGDSYIYRLDENANLIWKRPLLSGGSSIGKLKIVNNKLFVLVDHKVCRVDMVTGFIIPFTPVGYSAFDFVDAVGIGLIIEDFDVDIFENIYVALKGSGNNTFVKKIPPTANTPTDEEWSVSIQPQDLSPIQSILIALNKEETSLYIAMRNNTSNTYPLPKDIDILDNSNNVICTHSLSNTGNFVAVLEELNTPNPVCTQSYANLNRIDVMEVDKSTGNIYTVSSQSIRLYSSSMNLLGISPVLNYVPSDLYYHEENELLYSVGMETGTTGFMIAEGYDAGLSPMWTISNDLSPFGNPSHARANGICAKENGVVWVTGSIVDIDVTFNNVSVSGAGYDDLFVARIINGNTPNAIFAKQQNSSLQEAMSQEVKLLSQYEESIIISPNPSSGLFELSIPIKEGSVNVDIFNVQGKLIKSLQVENSRISIDLSTEISGIYMLRINYGNEICTKKVVLIK